MPHKDHNIAQVLEAIAATKPQATALVVKEGRKWQHYSFNRLATQCDQFATILHKEGISKDSRVILMVRPSFYFVALTFALFRLGAIVILIDPGMGYRNLLRCIASVQPEVLIGIRRAIFLSQLFPKAFTSLRKRLCVHGFFPGSTNLNTLLRDNEKPPVFVANEHERAAILFTTGSTGPPKGVCYTHGIFHAQLELIRDYYGIGEGDTDQPGFPLFGLFSTALGIKAVLPEMNPAHPARVNPGRKRPVGPGRHRSRPCRPQCYRCSGAGCGTGHCSHVIGALPASARRRSRPVSRARRGRWKRASVHVRALSRGFELTAADTRWSGIPSHVRPHVSASGEAYRKRPRHTGFCAAQQKWGEAERC